MSTKTTIIYCEEANSEAHIYHDMTYYSAGGGNDVVFEIPDEIIRQTYIESGNLVVRIDGGSELARVLKALKR